MARQGVPVRSERERGVCCELPAVDARWADSTADVLGALADPTRLKMMASVWRSAEPVCICDFTATLDLSQPTISHHMARLRRAGLVESEKRGIWVYYRVRDDIGSELRALLSRLLDLPGTGVSAMSPALST